MKKRLYVAYGSNLNIRQMAHRCPTAKMYGTGTIDDYELQFKGALIGAYATIAPKAGASVPVAIWEIKPRDERALDIYEGFPTHYYKQNISVNMDNGDGTHGLPSEVTAMVYIMDQRMTFGTPSRHYLQTVHEGYLDCGLDTTALSQALHNNILRCHGVTQIPELFVPPDDDIWEDTAPLAKELGDDCGEGLGWDDESPDEQDGDELANDFEQTFG